MPAPSRLHRATAIVPLAVLSAAWTVSLTGSGATTSITAVAEDTVTATTTTVLPDGSTVPTQAIQAPASLSSPTTVSRTAASDTEQIIATASATGIPAAALAAYQRAEAVINAADKSCRIPWQLIAAIGRVESNHSRFGGNTLSDEGVAQPGIYGIALNGENDTQKILDTDAGQLDSDTAYDRAVGPMQFIPSTWSVVGVDGDNDGKRNPQDIDDAALASAVYLCSGEDDLSTDQGQRASIFRYNHSDDYVDLVISIMQAYMAGDFTSVPNDSTSAGVFLPSTSKDVAAPARTGKTAASKGRDKTIVRSSSGAGGSGSKGGGSSKDGSSGGGSKSGTKSDSGNEGGKAGQSSASGGGTTSSPPKPSLPATTTASSPDEALTKEPAPTELEVNEPAVPPSSPNPVPSGDVTPLDQTLTVGQAQAQCESSGITTVDVAAMTACIDELMTP